MWIKRLFKFMLKKISEKFSILFQKKNNVNFFFEQKFQFFSNKKEVLIIFSKNNYLNFFLFF